MLIDWFTVIAQVINFLILVWLLKRFLYRPILNAIDAREKRIAAKIADADAKEVKAQRERDEYLQKNEEFDQQRKAQMNEALEAVKTERAQLLDAARQDAEELREKLQRGLRNEQQSLNEELSRRTHEEVFEIARKALQDLAGVSLEERMTEIFLQRLGELNTEQMAELKSVFKTSASLRVRTAFNLPEQQRAAIKVLITEILGTEKIIEFDIVPNLLSGIELSADGRKMAWSLTDYLASLEKSVDDLLKSRTETDGTDSTTIAHEVNKNDD